jgi:hypothetical protein
MSRVNKQDENNENEIEFEKKSLKEKYLEQTFLSIPVHEIIRLIVLVIVCQHLGSYASIKYTTIHDAVNANQMLQISMMFIFCYINTNFKLELSIMATIALVIIYVVIKHLNKNKIS